MKIGVAQIDCQVGDVEANCRIMASVIEEAAAAKCDLIVLPEMSDIGYDIDVIKAKASTWDAGPCGTLRELAARSRISVICGLSERVDERIYNTAAAIDQTGAIVGKYRKVHMFGVAPVCEDRHISAGDSLTVVELGGFNIGLMVCYDIRFPEMARALALCGAEVLVIVAAWPIPRIGHWSILAEVRAIENQAYVAAANRAGVDGPLTFGGSSCLIDPYGVRIASASSTAETLLTGEITRDRLEEVRSSMPVFDDRRAHLYAPLTQTRRTSM
jgi:predicted amidohydrolase